MKIMFKYVTLILFVTVSFISCKNKKEVILAVNKNDKLEIKLDSLDKLSNELKAEIKWIKKENPSIITEKIETRNCELLLFHPFGLNIQLKHDRPIIDNNNFLSIPAAYTSKQYQIDGLFIENGVEINALINSKLTGACIITNDNLQIIPFQDINEDLINELKLAKASFFQQTLLIQNNEIFPCKLFNNKKNLRRALVKFKKFSCIVQSSSVTIGAFQESLVNIGAISAVNLDMGTWSEGWYNNTNCDNIQIGETMSNTDKQTNWLIYSNK